jgi:undecaprenyl diphosphate synthase
VYAFSTENWKRPAEEVSGLMKLFSTFIRLKTRKLMREGVRFRVIGRRSDLSPALAASIARVEEKTASFEQQLVLAVSYGGRAEIVDAARKLVAEAATGQIRPEDVDEALVGHRLYAPDLPDPDLIIRTSGEQRISNFLLWECAYSEFYFTDTLWPDFSREDFDAALAAYAARDRRKGGHA